MREPQNNSDQSAFHLSCAHMDVQLILLMAALEENKTSAHDGETTKHAFTYTVNVIGIVILIHHSIIPPLQVHHNTISASRFLPGASWGPSGAPFLICGPSTETQVCLLPVSCYRVISKYKLNHLQAHLTPHPVMKNNASYYFCLLPSLILFLTLAEGQHNVYSLILPHSQT